MLRDEKQNFTLLTHLIISGIGFLGLVFGATRTLLEPYFEAKNTMMPYTEWALSALAMHKAVLLTSYLTGIIGIFAYFVFAVLVTKLLHRHMSTTFGHQAKHISFLALMIVANGCLLLMSVFVETPHFVIYMSMMWLALLILPVPIYLSSQSLIQSYFSAANKNNYIYYGIVAAAWLILCLAIAPFLKLTSLQVSNDYLWVPEKTYLQDKLVDNRQFVMSHGIGGLYQGYAIRSADELNINQFNHISVPQGTGVNELVESDKYHYEYVVPLQALLIKKLRVTSEDKERLCGKVGEESCQLISKGDLTSDINRPESSEAAEFTIKNMRELLGQILAGHYFHHQYAMLGPVNELMLGKSPTSINYLYGLGNAHFLAFAFNNIWHQMTFEYFTFTLYSFYLLYFFLYGFCCYILLRDIRYVALTTAIVVGLTLMVGHELIRVAPGFNPLRHFLDIFLIASFYAYLYARRFNALFLSISLICGLLAIYASKEFGLMMFFSLAAAAGIYILSSSKRYRDLLLLIAATFGLIAVHTYESASAAASDMSIYAMLGVSVAPSNRLVAILLLLMVFVSYCCLFYIYMKKGSRYSPLYVCLLLFFYCQCLWVYFAWYTEPGHLFSTSAIWVLFFVMIYKEVSPLILLNKPLERSLLAIGTAMAVFVLLFGSARYFIGEHGYRNIFNNHLVYQWNFPNAHFQSTMDPSVFEEGVGMLKSYSDGNAIYIISKYDNLLPFLAGKYSAMPYLELSTSLVTDHEVAAAVNAILVNKPKYLFVDSDINSTNFGDILDPSTKLKKMIDPDSLSAGRVRVLSESKRVFKKVASQYRLIKSGYLVSVYEHI